MGTKSAVLVAVELLAASVWVGSLACLAVVSAAARKVLDGPAQVAFFRTVGRRYAVVGTTSLLVAIGGGLTMAWPPEQWSASLDAAVALAGLLVLVSMAAMAQARALGRLRRQAMSSPKVGGATQAVRRGRRTATALRTVMACTTLAIVVLASLVIAR